MPLGLFYFLEEIMIVYGQQEVIRGPWKAQVYYPDVTLTKFQLYVSLKTCFRLAWAKEYFAFGFAILSFGFGVEYDMDAYRRELQVEAKRRESKS
jgi:hypothetical protein